MIRISLASSLLMTLTLTAEAQLEGAPTLPDAPVQAADWIMPRTEHGHPDLQGTWFFGSRTPLQRPASLGTQRTYSDQEARMMEGRMQQRLDSQAMPLDPNRGAPEAGARIGQEADDSFLAHYQAARLVPVNGEYRTSVIVDPVDGRIPLREDFKDFTARQRASGLGETDGPEGQPLSGRCLMFGSAVPSLTPGMMNPNLQIVQNRDYVMIMTEMVHDARIIRLNDEHFSNDIASWMGDSIGRWEGDTLVVHSRNFRPEQSSGMTIAMSEEFEVVERYTPVSDGEIHYAFTVYDQQAYTQPFSGERMLTRNGAEDRVYEFACHEGNYSLSGILAGARRQEVEQELGLRPAMKSQPAGASY
ncbi:MAG: hypothetical protein R3F41_05960 [Gammaproteobacteria bacterium]|nr:hypothetical protein [Pseudomonadales bacterium]MCP5348459.1 hypothetical protein [Pseudomonadales bacterium]